MRTKHRTVKAPREHGFWVMLSVAVATSLCLAPTARGLLFATAFVALLIFGAAMVGKLIRKNSLLQASAAMGMGLVVLPMAWLGGAQVDRSAYVAGALCAVFVSSTLAVQSLLLEGRKHVSSARVSRTLSLVVAGLGTGAGLFWANLGLAVALGLVLALAVSFAVRPPSLKRLKRVGLTVAAVQLLAALLLVFAW